jgi:hypothetical protein
MKQDKNLVTSMRLSLNGSEQDLDPLTHSDCHGQS